MALGAKTERAMQIVPSSPERKPTRASGMGGRRDDWGRRGLSPVTPADAAQGSDEGEPEGDGRGECHPDLNVRMQQGLVGQ